MKRILITGGTGLIGSHLSGELGVRGYDIKVLSRNSRFSVPEAISEEAHKHIEVIAGDINDRELLEELVQNADVIFYKAASVGAAGAVENAKDFVLTNIGATANLIDVLRSAKHNIKDIILGSSISVYGEGNYTCQRCGKVRPNLRYNLDTTQPVQQWSPPCPNCGGSIEPAPTPETAERLGESTYAVTKKAQEELLIGTCRLLGINLAVFRYGTVLGAGQSWHNPFTRFLEALIQGEPPVLHEDGQQSRDFMFVDDVVAANLALLDKQPQGINVFNVGSGVSTPLMQFASALAVKMGQALNTKPVQPTIDGKFTAGDVRHCELDCSKIAAQIDFRPKQTLDDGINELVDSFVRKKGPVRNS